MPKASRRTTERFQVNVPLDNEHWHLVLLQLAIREGKSVPELLRPVIVAYLKRQLSADKQLAVAVASMEGSRHEAQEKSRRRRHLAEVTAIPPSGKGQQDPVTKRRSKRAPPQP
jgi:hypothetical protein